MSIFFFRQTLFSVCRELQSLFNEEREMSLKTMAFVKTSCKYEKVPPSCQTCLKVSHILVFF